MLSTILEASETRSCVGGDGDFIFVRFIFHSASNSRDTLTSRLMTCYWLNGLIFTTLKDWTKAVLLQGAPVSRY